LVFRGGGRHSEVVDRYKGEYDGADAHGDGPMVVDAMATIKDSSEDADASLSASLAISSWGVFASADDSESPKIWVPKPNGFRTEECCIYGNYEKVIIYEAASSLTKNGFDLVVLLFFPASAAASAFAFACVRCLASFFSNLAAYFSLNLKPRQARTLSAAYQYDAYGSLRPTHQQLTSRPSSGTIPAHTPKYTMPCHAGCLRRDTTSEREAPLDLSRSCNLMRIKRVLLLEEMP
jgi:hypothetical protein